MRNVIKKCCVVYVYWQTEDAGIPESDGDVSGMTSAISLTSVAICTASVIILIILVLLIIARRKRLWSITR